MSRPLGSRQPRDDVADRILERGDRAHRLAQLEHAPGVEREPVEQRARLAGRARGREILGVGLDDRGALALERERDLLERRVLGAAAERRQRARGGAGAGARGFSRHGHRGAPDYRDGWPRGRRRRPSAGRLRGAARRCPWPRRRSRRPRPRACTRAPRRPRGTCPRRACTPDRQQARAAREQRRARAGVDEHAPGRGLAVAQPQLPGRDRAGARR